LNQNLFFCGRNGLPFYDHLDIHNLFFSSFDLDLLLFLQVVKLKDVFPHGTGFVLVFEYMLSDLSEVIRNSQRPLTASQVKGYMMMLLKGVAFCHENSIMHRVKLFSLYH